jgi:methylmalonyl-CoA mutase
MPERLLAEFPPDSTAEWEAVIAKDLKGADYEKKLIWRTAEGMAVKPYYRAEDVAALDWPKAGPGEFPFVRGTKASGGWRIREGIDAADSAEANRAAKAAVASGAEEIAFGKINAGNVSDIALLLSGLDSVPVHISAVDERMLHRLLQHLKKAERTEVISTGFDPLKDVELAAQIAVVAPPEFVPFTIDGARLGDAGANAVEEVGFAMAAGVDYLAAMQKRGVDPARAAALVEFRFVVGSKYFFEIAKLRAFRMLWARAVESFGAPGEIGRARIAARTSRWNKTLYDPHVNVLRATTEAMAAVLGGADSVSVAPFDDCYTKPDEASRRLARNTQIMLKREAMLERVADPGGGAYALEAITDYLAREAWKLMQEVEAQGGYRKAAVWIKRTVAQSLAAREKAVETRRRVFVGTNQYANATETALNRIDAARMSTQQRGTHAFEELRLRTERSGKIPHILLCEIGDAKMRAARATFAANFFACAGFQISAKRFKSVDEILTNEADVIVLCSSDSEYAALAAEILPKLKAAGRTTPVIVAGNPENAAELTAAGIGDFIHVRSNLLEVLARWQQRLGIAAAAGKE